MRFLLVAFIACLSGVSVVAQCPIQPRAASLDASGKNFTIRYYNSSMRTAQDVQFVLVNEDAGLSGVQPHEIIVREESIQQRFKVNMSLTALNPS